jgi:hypothetical protein
MFAFVGVALRGHPFVILDVGNQSNGWLSVAIPWSFWVRWGTKPWGGRRGPPFVILGTYEAVATESHQYNLLPSTCWSSREQYVVKQANERSNPAYKREINEVPRDY